MEIDELMKHGLIRPPSADGSPGVLSPIDDLFMPAEKEWLPDTLHAAMYLLASKYGITELKDKAALEIEIMLTELDFERTYFMPLLAGLFGVQKGCAVEKSAEGGERNHDDDCNANGNAVEDGNRLDPDTKALPVAAAAPAVPSSSNPPVTLSRTNDAKVWDILADEAANGFDTYQHDPVFQHVMVNHPHFNWEVSTRLQKKFAEAQTTLAQKEELIHGLAIKDAAKGKRTRKRKAKEETTAKGC
ncbi:hypothetical protein PV04_00055 [Phialophora macrospora]|uniref:Uncharacterized protein n=1 Tax=Phialophora macrospora TaxID=1851006 RepID=A0A0D2FTP9_9EURO|nr:hypothetical protein PV04_00055 [Phialophora macrospora]